MSNYASNTEWAQQQAAHIKQNGHFDPLLSNDLIYMNNGGRGDNS